MIDREKFHYNFRAVAHLSSQMAEMLARDYSLESLRDTLTLLALELANIQAFSTALDRELEPDFVEGEILDA